MKKFGLIFFILTIFYCFPTGVKAEVSFGWAKQIGASNFQEGKSIALDSKGNVYTTGYFYGSVDFDPGSNTYILSSAGTSDIFISKLDSNGNFLWARQMGGTDYDQGNSIAIDSDDNVYLTGYFSGMADFDPGPEIYNAVSLGGQDMFIEKLDSDGNFLWLKQLGGIFDDRGNSIAFDSSQNIYWVGSFRDTMEIDFGDYSENLISVGGHDIFVSKISPSSNFIWAKNMGGEKEDQGYAIAVDADGNSFLTGSFQGTVDFDPSINNFYLTAFGGSDIFIDKLDKFGNLAWAKQIGGIGDEEGYAISLGPDHVYTTGYFGGMADFDPSNNNFFLSSSGPTDIFVSKLNLAGDFVWAKKMGGPADDYGNSISVDFKKNIFVTGSFRGMADFDPGKKIFNLTSFGMSDIFINKLNSFGNFIWALQMGGVSFDGGNSIVIGSSNDIYTTGYFQSTADFDPGVGVFNLVSLGGYDVFINKLISSPFRVAKNLREKW